MLIHDFDSCQNSYEGKQLQPASTSILIPFAEKYRSHPCQHVHDPSEQLNGYGGLSMP